MKRGIQPKSNDVFLKGFELFEQNRYQEALRAFQASVKASPDNAVMHYGLGLMYLFTGDRDAALNEYQNLKTLDTILGEKLIGFISPSRQYKLEI